MIPQSGISSLHIFLIKNKKTYLNDELELYIQKDGKYKLIIPNREIHNLFIKQIREWFDGVTKSDGKKLRYYSRRKESQGITFRRR